jgi:hypothetical protein
VLSQRDRGVGREQQPDLLRLVPEGVRSGAVQVERTEVLAAHVELDRQHAGRADLPAPGGKRRPPRLRRKIGQPHGPVLVQGVQHGPSPVSYCAWSTARASSPVAANVRTSRRLPTDETLAYSTPGTVPVAACTIASSVPSTSNSPCRSRASVLSFSASVFHPDACPVYDEDGSPRPAGRSRVSSLVMAPSLPFWYLDRHLAAQG